MSTNKNEVFDIKKLHFLESSAKKLAYQKFAFCKAGCTSNRESDASAIGDCKINCYQNSILPWKRAMHLAQDIDDKSYVECLGKNYPDIEQEDFFKCSKVFKGRQLVLSKYIEDTCLEVIQDSYPQKFVQ